MPALTAQDIASIEKATSGTTVCAIYIFTPVSYNIFS